MRVAVDVMTSEKGVSESLEGVFLALRHDPALFVLAVGIPEVVIPLMQGHPFGERLALAPASEVIGMNDDPGAAFKAKKDASVTVTARLVKEGKADAGISPGNTGASMTAATLVLGRIEGVRRPAIVTLMPNGNGFTALLDSGAVVDCKADDLVQWGMMGSIFMQRVRGVNKPRVGLLSIGEEDKKGNLQTLEALPLMREASFNFVGNVEGRDLFNGHCDVAVCDGFVGNVVLKTAEGLSKMMLGQLKDAYQSSGLLSKLGGLLSKPVFRAVGKKVSPDEVGGAPLLGVAGNFVITHGSANRTMIKNAVLVAHQCALQNMVGTISAAFAPAPGRT